MSGDLDPLLDDLLDAFGPDDLADPALAELDAAVDRLAGAAAPRRRSAGLLGAAAAGALGGLLAAGLAAGVLLAPFAPAPFAPGSIEPRAPAESVAPAVPAEPVARQAPPAAHDREEAPAARPADAPPPRPTVRRARQPGLVPSAEAELTIASGRAILASGLLTWLHDADHDPGVRQVDFRDLPVRLVPVGTAFVAGARRHVGAVRVTDGAVRVIHDDGTLLAQLAPGQEAVTVPDPAAPLGVRLIQTTGLPLDALAAQLPPDCPCQPRDVVASIATLRLATMPATPDEERTP